MKMMILAIMTAAFLSVLPYASAQQAGPQGIPTNLPGVTAAPAPPEGFDPLTASDEELATYGFPPRPDEYLMPGAYAAWAKAMKTPTQRVFPVLELTDHYNGPAVGLSKNTNGTSTSENWSGVATMTSAASYNNSTSFYWIMMDYVVPVAIQAYGACTGGWDYSSSWVGIDGYGTNDVLQAGTESDAYCSGNTQSTTYRAWYEWYPNPEVIITSIPVYPGDDLFVQVWSTSATAGHAYFANYSTDKSAGFAFSAPSGTKLIGSTAEWIVERPDTNTGLATLTNYVWDYFSSASAITFGGTCYYPSSSAADLVTMQDNSGNAISAPALLGTEAIWFQDEGSAR